MTPGAESSGPAVAAGGDDRLEETPRAAPAPGDLSEAGEGPIDWWAVLSDIDGLRSAALRQRDAAAIAQYAEPGSTAWEEDSHLIADLRARGLVPEGLSTRIVGMEQVQVLTDSGPGGVPGAREQGAGELGQPTPRDSDPPDSGGERGPSDVDPDEAAHEAVLVVVDERSTYRLVDPSGAVVAEIPASGLRRWQLRLAPGPPGAGRWLLRSAEPMP
jgi:hypothetical protein